MAEDFEVRTMRALLDGMQPDAQRQRERAAYDWQQRALPWLRRIDDYLEDDIDWSGSVPALLRNDIRALLAEAATAEGT